MRKEEEIIKKAVDLFVEKGYAATSMQEVAEGCSISKGTLYNFFKSKEKLLVRTMEYSYEQNMSEINRIDLDGTLSAKEKLIKKIALQFDLIVSNKNFVLLLVRKLDHGNNQDVAEIANKIYMAMLGWYRKSILETFGEKAEACIWDYTFMLQGIIKEYMLLAIRGVQINDSKTLAGFLVDRLGTLIEHSEGAVPLLTSAGLSSFTIFDEEPESPSLREQISRTLDELEKKLEHLLLPEDAFNEAVLAIHSLREEFGSGQPRPFMVKALLLYLDEFKKCGPLVRRIRQLADTLYT